MYIRKSLALIEDYSHACGKRMVKTLGRQFPPKVAAFSQGLWYTDQRAFERKGYTVANTFQRVVSKIWRYHLCQKYLGFVVPNLCCRWGAAHGCRLAGIFLKPRPERELQGIRDDIMPPGLVLAKTHGPPKHWHKNQIVFSHGKYIPLEHFTSMCGWPISEYEQMIMDFSLEGEQTGLQQSNIHGAEAPPASQTTSQVTGHGLVQRRTRGRPPTNEPKPNYTCPFNDPSRVDPCKKVPGPKNTVRNFSYHTYCTDSRPSASNSKEKSKLQGPPRQPTASCR